MLNSIFELSEALASAKANGDHEAIAVCYHSASNPSNRHYAVVRDFNEYKSLKAFYADWDYIFTPVKAL
jgi:hypothetical protein